MEASKVPLQSQSFVEINPRIEKVSLYGSRAQGTHRKGSDIDLVITGERFTERDLSRLESELDDLLLPCTFDLSLHSSISSGERLEHIKRVGKDIEIKQGEFH